MLDISMVIAKTASRNVAFKAARLGDLIFDRQSEILRTEDAQVNSPSHEEDLAQAGIGLFLLLVKSSHGTRLLIKSFYFRAESQRA